MSHDKYEEYIIKASDYLQVSEQQKAIDFLKTIQKENPDDLDALKALTVFYYIVENDEVSVCCDNFLDKKPDDNIILSIKGAYLFRIGQEDLSKEYLEHALELDNQNFLANKFMGLYNLFKNKNTKALHYFNNAINLSEDGESDLLSYKGMVLFFDSDYEEALKSSESALEIDNTNLIALEYKGLSLQSLNKHDDAINAFNDYLNYDSNHVDILNAKVTSLIILKRYDEALKCLESILKIDMNHFALKIKAELLFDLKRYKSALIAINSFLELKPNHVEMLLLKARTLWYLDKDEEAIKIINYALTIDLNNLDLIHWKGEILKYLKKYDEAIKCAETIIKQENNNVDAINLLGTIYYVQNLLEKSLEYFYKVLEINPNNGFALLYAKRALKRLGYSEEAKGLEYRIMHNPTVDRIVLEKQLENWIVKDISLLNEFGYDLELTQQQFICKDERKNIFDILSEDKEGNIFIIELKVVKAGIETFEQISRYIKCFNENYPTKKNIYGVVISYGCNNDFELLLKDSENIYYIDIDDLGF